MRLSKTQIIGAILLSTGKSVEEVAAEQGYTKASFYNVISGASRSTKLRAIIEQLAVSAPVVTEIHWPEPARKEKE
jgi:hypothetical protein